MHTTVRPKQLEDKVEPRHSVMQLLERLTILRRMLL